jgi:SAM-dependent methyltransferase
MSDTEPPLPPKELIDRIGDDRRDTVDHYLEVGSSHRRLVEQYLPGDWVWSDKTYLDWGSGAGRLIRHFRREATTNRVLAADIHAASIAWINDNLAPVEGLVVDEDPGIALADHSVDLVTGFSVMTHLTDSWAGWLLEIRRVLKPDGLALLSFCGEAMIPNLLARDVPIDDIGMLVVKYGTPWLYGGPTVLHSPWWIDAHWGRAFEVLRHDAAALQGTDAGQDLVLLRPRHGAALSVEALEAIEPDDPREFVALTSALRQAQDELSELRGDYERIRETAYLNGLVAEDRALQLAYIRASHSWRLTRPIRRLASRMKGVDESTLE